MKWADIWRVATVTQVGREIKEAKDKKAEVEVVEDKREQRVVKLVRVVGTKVRVVPVRPRKTEGGSAELNRASAAVVPRRRQALYRNGRGEFAC